MTMTMMMMTYYRAVQGTPCSSGRAAEEARDRWAAIVITVIVIILIVINHHRRHHDDRDPHPHLWTLGLDVLASHSPHDPTLFVDLKWIQLIMKIEQVKLDCFFF